MRRPPHRGVGKVAAELVAYPPEGRALSDDAVDALLAATARGLGQRAPRAACPAAGAVVC